VVKWVAALVPVLPQQALLQPVVLLQVEAAVVVVAAE
jgi:hypothetical protein